jgi:hypothetical protein
MTVLIMRREHGEFVVTGPEIEPGPTHPINRPGRGPRSGVSPERTGRLKALPSELNRHD